MDGCIYQTEDGRCMKFSNGKSQSWCVGKDEPCGYRKPSNADRIRAMTDEELAYFMANIEPCRESAWLEWLKQEASE